MPRYSSFEEYCAHLTEHNQELIISIDEYILTNFTEIGRSIKWNCPFYTLNSLKDGYIGYLNVSKSKVYFGFYEGKHLWDERGLLASEDTTMIKKYFFKETFNGDIYFLSLISQAIEFTIQKRGHKKIR
jgi:hypothetical protein